MHYFGERPLIVADIHTHPVEPRTVRVAVSSAF